MCEKEKVGVESMKFVIQRVNHASVTVEGKVIGAIHKGFLVLIGVSKEDTKEIADAISSIAF